MPRLLTIRKTEGKPGQVYYPLEFTETPNKPVPASGELLVRIRAASLNHRDHFIRQHLYPGIGFGAPMLADGTGVVEALGPDAHPPAETLLHKRVLLTPMRGWAADPAGPEDEKRFSIAGGGRTYPDVGYARDWIAVPAAEVEPCPDHLSDAEAAALPLVGLTAWRALVTKAGLGLRFSSSKDAEGGKQEETKEKDNRKNILITGIGGGVALQALQFAVAFGNIDVWVTSSSTAKVEQAIALGAKGGVLYRGGNDDADPKTSWDKKLATQLPRDRPYLDAVIDGAGGDVIARAALKLLRPGGAVVVYGMTVGPKMDWLMGATLRNIELRGTTMGSRAEFADMVAFVKARRVRPVVSRVVRVGEFWGLEKKKKKKGGEAGGEEDGGYYDFSAMESLFADIRAGRHFGKLVVEISTPATEEEDKNRSADKADAKL